MNYDNPELKDKLAAEYVIGTLHGKARQRFERLLQQDFELHRRVWYWERRLTPLASSWKPITPSKKVWQTVQGRLFPEKVKRSLWSRAGFWQGFGLLATAAAVVLAVQLNIFIQQPQIQDGQFLTVLASEESHAAWMVRVDQDTGNVSVKALNVDGPGLRKVFELWMLPKDQSPKSMGLMPVSGELNLPIKGSLVNLLQDADGLAVSLEPEGGSPTGAPTGPVLYQGKLLSL